MKNRKLIAPFIVLIASCAALIVAQMNREEAKRTVVVLPEAPYDQLPPAPAPGKGAYVNKARLRQLADSKDYRGPSFKEDYSRAEVLMAAKARNAGRLPAAQEPAQPQEQR